MTPKFMLDLVVLLIAYGLLAVAYAGLGGATCAVLRLDCGSDRPFVLIWLGWSVSILLLELLNILLPISATLSIILLGTGMVLGIRILVSERRRFNWRWGTALYGLAVFSAGCWIAALALRTPTNYDAGLYYFNTIRWLNEYPLVLGLGNLHVRLAYNQSFFTYVAAVNLFPVFRHGHNLAASFLWLVLFAELLPHRRADTRGEGGNNPPAPTAFIGVLFVPVLLYMAINSSVSSSPPDLASSILQIYVFILFARRVLEGKSGEDHSGSTATLLIILATMVTIKLSNLAYSLSMAAVLLAAELRREAGLKSALSRAIRLAGVPALIFVVWAGRGVLLSGCPAVPSTLGCVRTEWSAPLASVNDDALYLYSWARVRGSTPDEVLGSWAWLGPWLTHVSELTSEVVYPLAISILAALAAVTIHGKAHRLRRFRTTAWLLPIPAVVGLVTWFFVAPLPRYAQAQFWVLSVATALNLFTGWMPSPGKARRASIVILFVILNASFLQAFATNPQALVPSAEDGFGPIPMARLEREKTDQGLVVWKPRESDQCWDSRLPCTPYFDSALVFVDRYPFPEFRRDPSDGSPGQ